MNHIKQKGKKHMSDVNFKTLLTATLNESDNDNDGIVTPAMVNKHLKDHFGYGFVKHEVLHSGLGLISKKASSEKGIEAASHSPMNVTSAAFEHTADKLKKIHSSLIQHLNGERDAGDYNNDKVTFNRGTKKEFTTHLHVDSHPTYHHSVDRDNGYKTDWIKVSYIKASKK